MALVPYLKAAGELKTKPAQHSVKELMSLGIRPDILVCRTEHDLNEGLRKKLAMFCDIDYDAVIEAKDASTIYEIPLIMEKEGLADVTCKKLGIENRKADLVPWEKIVYDIKNPQAEVKIAVVGKYVELKDAYISINESLEHAAYSLGYKARIKYIQAENLDVESLKEYQGILVPGGFGNRGVEGKIAAIKYARENKIPFLGICLGMQLAVVEFARNVLGYTDANSSELDENTTHPVIHIMEDQKYIEKMGGTMRLGAYPCILGDGTLAKELYESKEISERHRHRYEYNNIYREELEKAGLKVSGTSPDNTLVEIVELPREVHLFYIAGQFHPEFKTRPNRPHPLFKGFIEASTK